MMDLDAFRSCEAVAPSKSLAMHAYFLWAFAQKKGWKQARKEFSNGAYYRALAVLRAAGLLVPIRGVLPQPRFTSFARESSHQWLSRLPGIWFEVKRAFDPFYPVGHCGQIQAVCFDVSGIQVRVVPREDLSDMTELPLWDFLSHVRLLDEPPPEAARLTASQLLENLKNSPLEAGAPTLLS